MTVTKQTFIRKLQDLGIGVTLTDKIENNRDSPLTRGFQADFPQSNDMTHSNKVFKNVLDILNMVSHSRLNITCDDYLILCYASLLHDISKSKSQEVENDIDKLKSSVKCCKLTSDHGVISAHYIKLKCAEKHINLYGLKNGSVRKLLNIISFHNSGIMHAHFVAEKELVLKELFLCLVFWLIDTVEGTNDRVKAALMVDERILGSKTLARLGVDKVLIENSNVVWIIKGESCELDKALAMTNSELSKHSLLLQVFGLPSRVIARKKDEKIPKQEPIIDYNHLISANLYADVSKRDIPLVLSGKTLPELYDKMVEAFCQISVDKELSSKNYFGPVTLEVKDVENDRADKISIRSESKKNYLTLKNYTERWLSDEPGAEKDFYFGYTHGQRIYDYFYPSNVDDFNNLLKTLAKGIAEDKRQGQLRKVLRDSAREKRGIQQFKHISEILQQGEEGEARRAYVVIPNLIIDNPTSCFHIQEEMAPALLAIQFMIEKDRKLSGFALLRAQELSTFFVVNYLEVKELINKLITELRGKFPGIKPGRIVMLSAFGYFDPSSPLLDKPKLCSRKSLEYQTYGFHLNDPNVRDELIRLLKEYKRDYKKIETEWCNRIKESLEDKSSSVDPRKKPEIIAGIDKLKQDLDSLERKRGRRGHSITREFREEKIGIINGFIKTIKEVFDVRG